MIQQERHGSWFWYKGMRQKANAGSRNAQKLLGKFRDENKFMHERFARLYDDLYVKKSSRPDGET